MTTEKSQKEEEEEENHSKNYQKLVTEWQPLTILTYNYSCFRKRNILDVV